MKQPVFFLGPLILALSCNVGTHNKNQGIPDGIPEGIPDVCPRGLVVVSSDLKASSNVYLLDLKGASLTRSLISSGSQDPETTCALSQDIALPSDRVSSGVVVLIDRYPNSVVTYVDPINAQVLRQVNVSTGFPSNPHDYVEISPTKAYVSRYETNTRPNQQANDIGGDVLIINPSTGEICGRVDLSSEGNKTILPRPDRMTIAQGKVLVTMGRLSADFSTGLDFSVVAIDPITDTISYRKEFTGLAQCNGVSWSPSGKELALACSGIFGPNQVSQSGILILDANAHPITEKKRYTVPRPIQPSVSWTDDRHVVSLFYGTFPDGTGSSLPDEAFVLNLDNGQIESLFKTAIPYTLGDVRCFPTCSSRCIFTDVSAKAGVRTFHIGESGGQLTELPPMLGETPFGLPPRALSIF